MILLKKLGRVVAVARPGAGDGCAKALSMIMIVCGLITAAVLWL